MTVPPSRVASRSPGGNWAGRPRAAGVRSPGGRARSGPRTSGPRPRAARPTCASPGQAQRRDHASPESRLFSTIIRRAYSAAALRASISREPVDVRRSASRIAGAEDVQNAASTPSRRRSGEPPARSSPRQRHQRIRQRQRRHAAMQDDGHLRHRTREQLSHAELGQLQGLQDPAGVPRVILLVASTEAPEGRFHPRHAVL